MININRLYPIMKLSKINDECILCHMDTTVYDESLVNEILFSMLG
jgi:hypothetical protein